VLEQTVLARVVGDDREAAAGRERVAEHRERPPEPAELVVDGDTDRLKEAGEIRRSAARSERGADGVHEVVAHGERRPLAAAGDLPRQPPRARLVAVLGEDPHQLGLVEVIEDIGGARPSFDSCPHPHVERRPWAESKATLRLVQLPRRDAEIH
jgi:hypothetical protein